MTLADRRVTWRVLVANAAARLGTAGAPRPDRDARWIVEQASGWEGADHVLHLDDAVPVLGRRSFAAMLERRCAGEPIQYVLGRWGFRRLDLYLDRRVLIPRPETEQVVEAALEELDRIGAALDRGSVAVDLGTGSGAIALALVSERSAVDVWATDESDAALAVARANIAGVGRPGTRVRVAEGDWFDALPSELRGRVDVVVSNPPYVAASEVADLPAEVSDWEPVSALVAGPTGLEAIEVIVTEAPGWLSARGSLVVEHAPGHTVAVAAMARRAGFADAETRRDLAGRYRMLVARLRANVG